MFRMKSLSRRYCGRDTAEYQSTSQVPLALTCELAGLPLHKVDNQWLLDVSRHDMLVVRLTCRIRALVGYDTSDLKSASALVTQALPQCPPDLPLLEAMAYFQTGRSHILLVTVSPGKDTGAVGIVTLEDVVEVSGV